MKKLLDDGGTRREVKPFVINHYRGNDLAATENYLKKDDPVNLHENRNPHKPYGDS